jgi:hypothetical protein
MFIRKSKLIKIHVLIVSAVVAVLSFKAAAIPV